MRVVIIGGVAGGASVAARLRRLDEDAEIILLERGSYVSYANCGLPYYIGGVIQEKSKLSVLTPESMAQLYHIDVRTGHEAVAVDPVVHSVTVRGADDETYSLVYDKLVLSPGARPIRPPIPGVDDPRIFTLRTIPDTFAIRECIDRDHPEHAVIVGGGFIGLEMAENLRHAGLSVTLVEKQDQLLPAMLDPEMAAILHPHIEAHGIGLRLGAGVTGFVPQDQTLSVQLENEALSADLVLLSVGVAPDTGFLQGSGLALTPRGLIETDDTMLTSDPDIYALGDAAQVRQRVSGEAAFLPLAGPANRQARVVAERLCGMSARYPGTQGSAIVQAFGLTIASTGLSEKSLRESSASYDKVYTTAASHASYYPGAVPITLKALFDPTDGRILGAQLLGQEGVDKRCDVLSTAISARQGAAFLGDVELCYAPPYNTARDPVNMIGYMIADLMGGLVRQFHWHDVPALIGREDITLLDVRPAHAFAEGHLPGAVNIPMNELRTRMDELAKDKPIYVNCRIGQTSYNACRLLSQRGYDCQHLAGGFALYAYQQLPIERTEF